MSPSIDYYKNLLDKLFDCIVCVDSEKKITFWNRSAEKLSGYPFSEVAGRSVCEAMLIHCPTESVSGCGEQCPLELVFSDGDTRESELFLRHREGHSVPITCRIEPIRDSRGEISGAVQVFHDNSSRIAARSVIEKLRKLALIDPLTGLVNRRYLERVLESKTDEMKRYDLSFGLVFIDVDHFKKVNDRYGHDTGDKVLRGVAQSLSTVVRSSDVIGRWGGEEFVAIVQNLGRGELEVVAEKMRKTVEELKIDNDGEPISVTISLGATLASAEDGLDKSGILRKADRLLYTSKDQGRNRVTIG